MPGGRWILGCAFALAAAPAGAQPPDVAALVERAGAYVSRFVDEFSNVVSEERYTQESVSNRTGTSSAGTRRELRSDFLLVRPSAATEWVPFRDVFSVDGSAVRGREERLTKLFIDASPAALEQAGAIAAESSRYNLGNVRRTVNNPFIGLAFLQPVHHQRFTFALGKRDDDLGRDVWIVEARETARPTLITGAYGRDMPARGRYWIAVANGTVLRTELAFTDVSVAATVSTEFKVDDAFGLAVPVRMRESYIMTGLSSVTGQATYGRFRRFGVTASETVTVPRH